MKDVTFSCITSEVLTNNVGEVRVQAQYDLIVCGARFSPLKLLIGVVNIEKTISNKIIV